jgi:hypothetical protein
LDVKGSEMTIEYVHFVRHQDIEGFYGLGWCISDFLDGTPHGQYAVICEWKGRGEPRTPLQNQPDSNDGNQRFPLEGGGVLKGTLRDSPDIQQSGEGCGVD